MEKIIYIRTIKEYNEVSNKNIPNFLKRVVFLWRNLWKIPTKQKIDETKEQWILPYREKITSVQFEKIIKKQRKKGNITRNAKVVLSNILNTREYQEVLKDHGVSFIDGSMAKNELLLKAIEYINKLQHKEMQEREITVLANENTEESKQCIILLALQCNLVKVVSKHLYQFKKLEESLYKEKGIALQFSNSYRKSLKNSEIIINLDFNEIEFNEYQLNSKAIIFNMHKEINIKAKAFQGAMINSYQIKFSKELETYFKQYHLYHSYDKLLLYESMQYHTPQPQEKNKKKDIKIQNLIGKNGIVDAKELKKL